MRECGRFAGTWKIARFNWPIYATALAVLFAALALSVWTDGPLWKLGGVITGASAAWFLVGSLGASHLVYDRSDLHRGVWLARALGGMSPRNIAVCHCGYDEISALLRDSLPGAEVRVLDHYDDATMSEPSIRRARRLFPPAPGTTSAPFAAWPVAAASLDAVFGVLAIHELRAPAHRAAWFAEARRCLTGGGRVLLVEHLRDFANFAAFGPGFVHFHSAATWRRAWERHPSSHATNGPARRSVCRRTLAALLQLLLPIGIRLLHGARPTRTVNAHAIVLMKRRLLAAMSHPDAARNPLLAATLGRGFGVEPPPVWREPGLRAWLALAANLELRSSTVEAALDRAPSGTFGMISLSNLADLLDPPAWQELLALAAAALAPGGFVVARAMLHEAPPPATATGFSDITTATLTACGDRSPLCPVVWIGQRLELAASLRATNSRLED